MAFIKSFKEVGKGDAAIAGGKGASLGEMTQAGIPVPPGYIILASAFEHFLEETGLSVEIDSILKTVKIDKMETVDRASEQIQTLIFSKEVPHDISSSILQNYKTLGAAFVAVRSSATAEDSASAAWAGQLDTFLNTTEPMLIDHVLKCWASLFTPRAIFYRFEKGLQATKISVAVVVQKMVNADVAGVAFSVHPVTEDRNQMIIEGAFGLGEAVVSGQITPDSYVVTKMPRAICDKHISEKSRGLFRKDGGGNEWNDIEPGKQSAQALSDEQILTLADMLIKIESHYSFPVDTEWAMEAGTLYFTQSRPITTLSNQSASSLVEEILQKLGVFKKEDWNEEGRWVQPTFVCTFFEHWNSAESVRRIIPGTSFGTFFNLDGYVFFPKTDRIAAQEYLRESYKKDELAKLVTRIDNEGEKQIKKLNALLAHNDTHLRSHIGNFVEVYREFTSFWNCAAYLGDQVIHVAKDVGYIRAEADLFGKVQPYLRKTWIEEEVEDALQAARTNDFASYVEKYRWIRFVKWSGEPIDELYARKRGEEEEKNDEMGNHITPQRTSADPDGMIAISVATAYWRAECGRVEMYTAMRMQPVLQSIARDLGIGYEQLLFLTPSEVVDAAHALASIDITEAARRAQGFFSIATEDGREIVLSSGAPAYERLQTTHLSRETNGNADQLVGIGASPGKVQGRVRVVNSVQEGAAFENGEILVAPETTPSFVPFMRKAAAILTGRGGITSHAAIVSRELKKPCIINIKDVTRILKSGDLVEVDAEKGIVKILSHA